MKNPEKKILVTGAAGFIGFHLVKSLVKNNYQVVGLDNINDYYDVSLKYARLSETGINTDFSSQGSTSNSNQKREIPYNTLIQSKKQPSYSFIRMHLEDREQLNKLFEEEKFTTVCHLAAQAGVRYSIKNPFAYIQSNINGYVNILEACRHNHIGHLIYASSSSVYGNSSDMPLRITHNVDHPISLYAATKKSNELMAFTYSHLYNLPTTGLRFFTVYGPWGRPDMAYYIFTKNIIEGKPIKIFNKGHMHRDFTYIDDIVKGMNKIIETPQVKKQTVPYKLYNIGNSSPVLLLDFIHEIEEVLGKKAIKEFLPMQPGDVVNTKADVNDLIKDFGYKPATTIKAGISRFVNWYMGYYK